MPVKGQRYLSRPLVQMLELVVQPGSGLRDCGDICIASNIASLEAPGFGGWAVSGSAGLF